MEKDRYPRQQQSQYVGDVVAGFGEQSKAVARRPATRVTATYARVANRE